jgi:polar amino acid transport system substrate-binding protein
MRRWLALPICSMLVVAACGSNTSTPSSITTGATLQANIAAEVPAAIKAKGALQVGVDATYAPNEFIDPGTGQIRGWDIDLGIAIGKVIGVPLVFNNADFNSIIPDIGVRYDLGISSFTPSTKREQTVDFVTYGQAGEAWIVKTGGPQINAPTDLCGQTVAVETSTSEESDAWGFMGKLPDGSPIRGDINHCKAAGKADITVHSFTKQTDADADLLSGHAQIDWLDQPVADYQVKQSNGKEQISGKPCSLAPYGIALPKGSPLEPALQDALKYLIDHNYYSQILTNWSVTDSAITSSAVALNNNATVGSSCVPSY